MKQLIFIAFSVFCLNTTAQITFEHDYDSASTIKPIIYQGHNQLLIVNFEISGYCYVKINRWSKSIQIYNINHLLYKTIDCSMLPLDQGQLRNFIYFSEQLFNTDSKIEFLYGYANSITYPANYTGIYNEDGVLLFSDTLGVPIVDVNTLQQQYPIYNTSQGTKMILSYPNGHAKVFSLPGTLSASIEQANMQLMQQNGHFGNLYPNPGPGAVTIEYELPKGEAEGEIVLYNMQGLEVKRYGVDNTFKDIYLDNSMLPAGTYLWQLQTAKGAVGSKKMVVVK